MPNFLGTLRELLGFQRPLGMNASHEHLFDPTTENVHRFAKYRHNWEHYRGASIARMLNEDGTPSTRINYLKRNVDKVNWFAFGRPFRFTHPRLQDYVDVAMECWGSGVVEKLLRLGQFGSVCGDGFVMVAPTAVADAITRYNGTLGDYEVELPAQVKIVVINPAYCTPVYDPFDSETLLAVEISIPMRMLEQNNTWTTRYQHFIITKETITTSVRDHTGKIVEDGDEVPNPIKQVYVVHVRNYPAADSTYGADDIEDVSALNTALVEAINNIGQILKYHGDPITLVFGAKSSNLKKGPNKIWGNLPKDGRVENLTLESDLEAARNHVGGLRQDLHAMMGVPEIAQGVNQAISNTSGVALHTMYLPLIERAVTKHMIYGPKLIEIIILAIRWLEELNLMYTKDSEGRRRKQDRRKAKLTEEDYESLRQDGEMHFDLPLPKDRLIEAQIQRTLVEARMQTVRDGLVALGEKNPDRKLKEIMEERQKFKDIFTSGQAGGDTQTPESQENAISGEGSTGEHLTETEEQRGRPRTVEGGTNATTA